MLGYDGMVHALWLLVAKEGLQPRCRPCCVADRSTRGCYVRVHFAVSCARAAIACLRLCGAH